MPTEYMTRIPLAEIEAIIRNAAKLMLEADAARMQVEEKSGTANFVTEYDVRIQRELQTAFSALLPGCRYLAEEEGESENTVGDVQLYQVLQNHISAEEWTPDTASSLYKKIGVTEEGYPEWVQPLGASDAYNTGDVVSDNGILYKSKIDGNVWSPADYPQGWEVIE